jgi:hypothetical protein
LVTAATGAGDGFFLGAGDALGVERRPAALTVLALRLVCVAMPLGVGRVCMAVLVFIWGLRGGVIFLLRAGVGSREVSSEYS